jgi:HEAT repeat protein
MTLGQVGARASSAVPALTKLLDDPDPSVRAQAVQALSRMGQPGIKAALPDLIEALRGSNPSARFQAVAALRQVGGAEAAEAVTALIGMLDDPDRNVRLQAIQLLGQMNTASREVIPALVNVLRDPDRNVHSQAARALAGLGSEGSRAAVPVLVEALKGNDFNARFQAFQVLRQLPADGLKGAVPTLVDLLDDPQPAVRFQAAGILAQVDAGAGIEAARPVLDEMLKDAQPSNRIAAAQAMAKMKANANAKLGPDAIAPALAALTAILKDPQHNNYHLQAAQAMATLGPEGERAALPVLVASLRDGQQFQQTQALTALKGMKPEIAKEALPALIEALEDGDPYVRAQAAGVLGQMGPEARPAIPALAGALKDGNPSSSSALIQALAHLGPDGLKPLIAALEAGEGPPRAELVAVLGRVGPDARPALPALLAILGSEETDEALRRAVVQALSEIGPIPEPDLVRLLKDPNRGIRLAAAQTLIEGRDDPSTLDDVVPVLAEALRSDRSERRRIAAALAARFKTPPPAPISLLETALDDEDGLVRVRAAGALGKLADPAPRVIPGLIGALDDRALRSSAIDALEALGPTAVAAMPAMAGVLRQGAEPNDMIRAAYALARIGGAEAVEPLLGALDVIESGYRPLIVEALDQTGPGGIKELRRLLDHDDPAIRAMVVRHLGLRGSGREELKSVLGRVLADPAREVKLAALQVVGQLGSDARGAVPRLIELRDDDDSDGDATVRAEAAVALVAIEGTVATPSLPLLEAAARDRSHPSRWRVVEAMGRAGPPAVPALTEALRDVSTVRFKAAEALGRVGPEAVAAVPALTSALSTTDWPTRAEIALALGKIDRDREAEKALPMLVGALGSPALSPRRNGSALPLLPASHTMIRKFTFGRPSPTSFHLSVTYPGGHSEFVPIVDLIVLRRRLIEALGALGPQAKAALPLLSPIAESEDEDPEVRRAAAESLKLIGEEGD